MSAAQTGLAPALIGAAAALFSALALPAVIFPVAERPYFMAQQRRHA